MVSVPGVSGHILSSIISLIYSGEVTLDKTNVHDFFEAANILVIQNILQPIESQAKEQILNDEAVDDPDLEQLFNMTNDSDDSSDAESSKGEDDEKMDCKIERLMNLVTSDDVSHNDELDQLVTDLFKEEEKDPVEEENKKYTITGELRNPGRGHKNQKLSTVCPKCDKRFESRHGMMFHYRVMHTKEGRQKHLESVNRPRLCLECGKQCTSRSSYSKHMHDHHKPKENKYACDQCEYRSNTAALLSTHKKHNHMEKSFICDQCSKAYALKSQLDRHIRVVHQGIMINCPECDFKTGNKQGLKKHYNMIHLKMKFPCSICSKEYSTQFNLNTHTKRDHGFERKVFKKLRLEDGKTCMYKPTDGGTD